MIDFLDIASVVSISLCLLISISYNHKKRKQAKALKHSAILGWICALLWSLNAIL